MMGMDAFEGEMSGFDVLGGGDQIPNWVNSDGNGGGGAMAGMSEED